MKGGENRAVWITLVEKWRREGRNGRGGMDEGWLIRGVKIGFLGAEKCSR